jgi:hypothetical protein
METRGRPKNQNIKLWLESEDFERVEKALSESGEKAQDFFTMKAIEALTSTPETKERPAKKLVQFYLDPTIHKKLKQRAEALGVDMKDLLMEVLK